MSDSNPNLPASPPLQPAELPKLDPAAAMFALGSDVRWPIIKMLADVNAGGATPFAQPA